MEITPQAAVAVGAVIAAVVVASWVLMLVRAVRKWKRMGTDPSLWPAGTLDQVVDGQGTTLRQLLAQQGAGLDDVRAVFSGTAGVAPPVAQSVEQRLAAIDDLHTRGVISADERATARSAILGAP